MSNGANARSKFQAQSEAHMKHAKEHPEWMGQAIQTLKPWGDGDMTLQHAIAVALREAYEAGTRGDYPEVIDFRDADPDTKPPRMARSRPDNHTTAVRIQRGRLARTKQ